MNKLILTLMILSQGVFAQGKKTLNYFVIKDTAAPFQISQSKSNKGGIISDFLEEVLSDQYVLKHRVLPFNRMVREMKSGHLKNWINYGAPTWRTPQVWNMTKEPLLKVTHNILTKKGFSYKGINTLFDKRIVTIVGFNYPGLDKYINMGMIQTIEVKSHRSAIKAIQNGRAVAFPEMRYRIQYHLNNLKLNQDEFSLIDFSDTIKDYDLYISFSKKFPPEIQKHINDSIKKYKKDGRLQKIIETYSGK